jgi:hypothetical protein
MSDKEIAINYLHKYKFDAEFEYLEKHDKEKNTKICNVEGWLNLQAQLDDCLFRLG